MPSRRSLTRAESGFATTEGAGFLLSLAVNALVLVGLAYLLYRRADLRSAAAIVAPGCVVVGLVAWS